MLVSYRRDRKKGGEHYFIQSGFYTCGASRMSKRLQGRRRRGCVYVCVELRCASQEGSLMWAWCSPIYINGGTRGKGETERWHKKIWERNLQDETEMTWNRSKQQTE